MIGNNNPHFYLYGEKLPLHRRVRRALLLSKSIVQVKIITVTGNIFFTVDSPPPLPTMQLQKVQPEHPISTKLFLETNVLPLSKNSNKFRYSITQK